MIKYSLFAALLGFSCIYADASDEVCRRQEAILAARAYAFINKYQACNKYDGNTTWREIDRRHAQCKYALEADMKEYEGLYKLYFKQCVECESPISK